jgi:hypothetical protein
MISKLNVPMNSFSGMFWVASAYVIIEIGSNLGDSTARSFDSAAMVAPICRKLGHALGLAYRYWRPPPRGRPPSTFAVRHTLPCS